MTAFRFTLYVLGSTARAQAAERALRSLCSDRLGTDYALEVVDVVREPERAEAARIVVTPTLDRTHPEPPVRVLGDLTSLSGLATVLGLPLDTLATERGSP